MKIIVAGGRDFEDYELLAAKVDLYLSEITEPIEIVSGRARGADTLGERYASERGYPVKHFRPEWDRYGKQAGFKRNKAMAKYADALIAFWDGKSRGTELMIILAKEEGLKIRVVRY